MKRESNTWQAQRKAEKYTVMQNKSIERDARIAVILFQFWPCCSRDPQPQRYPEKKT